MYTYVQKYMLTNPSLLPRQKKTGCDSHQLRHELLLVPRRAGRAGGGCGRGLESGQGERGATGWSLVHVTRWNWRCSYGGCRWRKQRERSTSDVMYFYVLEVLGPFIKTKLFSQVLCFKGDVQWPG